MNLQDVPGELDALCALVFLLGMRHGFDADHLAAIDGLTRLNQQRQLWWARYCGALFSAGHGLVVVSIALLVGGVSQAAVLPPWLDALGSWISIVFLLVIGGLNFYAVWTTSPGRLVPVVSIKGWLLRPFQYAKTRLGVVCVGALFALSFDTISQSLMFAATASHIGGLWHALLLGLLFFFGMLVTDGINGWWLCRLIERTSAMAVVASRVMGCAVGFVSLLVAFIGLLKILSPHFNNWTEGKELMPGLLLIAVIAMSYWLAVFSARHWSSASR
jgi:high-affinity nickel-transport protein